MYKLEAGWYSVREGILVIKVRQTPLEGKIGGVLLTSGSGSSSRKPGGVWDLFVSALLVMVQFQALRGMEEVCKPAIKYGLFTAKRNESERSTR